MRDKELKLQEVEASRTLGGGVVYFIITQKKRARDRTYKGVGVVNDKELKREDVEALHTLGGAYCSLLFFITDFVVFYNGQK